MLVHFQNREDVLEIMDLLQKKAAPLISQEKAETFSLGWSKEERGRSGAGDWKGIPRGERRKSANDQPS